MKGMPHFRQYPMGDVVNANLEPGEYVVRRNAVNALGVDNMELLNHADSAHGALNKLMVSASLVNHQPQDNTSVKTEANGFPIADSPVRQRVDATRQMQGGGPVEEEPAEEGRGMMDYIHSGLDVAGMVPGLGIIPDIANAALYGGEALLAGDEPSRSEALALMGMSGAAAVPVLGQAATAGKWAVKGAKSAKRTRDILKQSKGVKYSAKVGDEEWDLSEGALGRLKKFYGDKYPSEMAVTAKFPKAGKQSAYEAGITPSGKFIPKGYQEGGYAEKYQKELESVPEKMQERLDLGMFTKKGGAYTPKGLADYLNVPLETSKFDTLSYSPNGALIMDVTAGDTGKKQRYQRFGAERGWEDEKNYREADIAQRWVEADRAAGHPSDQGTYTQYMYDQLDKDDFRSAVNSEESWKKLDEYRKKEEEHKKQREESPERRKMMMEGLGIKSDEEYDAFLEKKRRLGGGYQQGGPVYGYKQGGQVKGDVATGYWGGEQGDYMKALAAQDSTMAEQDSTISEQELKSMALMDHFRKMGTGERLESSDVYNGEPSYKSEDAYRRALGMQTPLNAKERFTQARLGLNPEMFTAQQRGLLGKVLLQRLGNEVQ